MREAVSFRYWIEQELNSRKGEDFLFDITVTCLLIEIVSIK